MRLLEYTKVFQTDAGGGHTSLLFRHVSSCACKNTRAFPSRELPVKHELFYLVMVVLANASFLISGVLIKPMFVVNTQTYRSRRFQVCACGAQVFSLQNVDLAGACVGNTRSSSRKCFKHALVANTQSFASRSVSSMRLWWIHELLSFRECFSLRL